MDWKIVVAGLLVVAFFGVGLFALPFLTAP